MMGGALRNRVLILLLVVIIIGFGAYSIRSTAIDAFPDVTNIQVEVMCGAPGALPIGDREICHLSRGDGHARACRAWSRCAR